MKYIFRVVKFVIFFTTLLYSKEFTVASYNVENLFDLKYNGTEYKEFIPNTKTWNKKIYYNKLKNIARVINSLDADILALQEIESKDALADLLYRVKQYKYSYFLKKDSSSIGVAILSKYPIVSTKRVLVNPKNDYARDILKTTIKIENKPLIIYVNHWRSKRAKENKRIIYATALKKDISTLPKDSDYIILGDLNSNYNEFITFKYDRTLNNTYGITGINQVLNTSIDGNLIKKDNIVNYDKLVHYNLWLELPKKDRFSLKFRNNNDTPDNIILPKSLFDNKNISYVDNSFRVFRPKYLYNHGKIIRFDAKTTKGYSDHLPIIATFSTSPYSYKDIFKNKNKTVSSISDLYNIDTLQSPILLKNIVVIYKYKDNTIIKQKSNRAIFIYKVASNLKLGYSYDIVVDEIDRYFGLKEIKIISNIKKINKIQDITSYYLDARKIDIFDTKYQNEIIKNLRGKYSHNYLYFRNHTGLYKIKIYFKKGIKKPKDGTKIVIKAGHLSIYKSHIQIVIYKNSDI